MINEITCSILEYTHTTYYDEMYNSVSKSTVLEPTIKQLMKETIFCPRAEHNLIRRGKNIREGTSLM